MKKICGIVFSFVLIAVMLAAIFPLQNLKINSTNAYVLESEITRKTTIVGTTNETLTNSFYGLTTTNNAPYDKNNGKMRSGLTVTPETTNDRDVDSTFSVNSFSLEESDSVFGWIYIPDEYLYSLTVSFYSSDGSISWKFGFEKLFDELVSYSSLSIKFGWCLFEFSQNDATFTGFSSANEKTFSTMNIKYVDENGLENETSNKLSLFDFYTGVKTTTKSSIIYRQDYVNSKALSTLAGGTYYVGDTIKLSSYMDLYSSFVIGKYDMVNYINPNFGIDITVSNTNSLNGNFTFNTGGEYAEISVTVTEYRTSGNKIIFSDSFSIFVDIFSIGSFSKSSYETKKGDTFVVTFYLNQDFISDGEINFDVSDKNVAKITNYEKNGNKYLINVEAESEGNVQILASCEGHRNGNEKKKYTKSCTLKIENADEKNSSIIFVWVIFGIYGIGFIVFIVISFVKARNFGVK